MIPISIVFFEQFLVTFFFSSGWIFQEATKEENGEMKEKRKAEIIAQVCLKIVTVKL